MNTYKIYHPDNSFICVTSLRDVADLCGVSIQEASKAFYTKAIRFVQFEVLTFAN
jgi:hypothetical protein